MSHLFVFSGVIAVSLYILAISYANVRHKRWPLHRTAAWFFGVACATASMIWQHADFVTHMISHLLLGMLAPLLIAFSAPMTLLLRSLPVPVARRFSHMLKSRPVSVFTHPIIASTLNIGGLFVLYTTGLYIAMHDNIFLFLFVHLHVFLAGYLFTIAIIYIDPAPHRFSFFYRAIVLILALAGHGILSKYIYAHPPAGVHPADAKVGGMLMYYGGDTIDVALIVTLCLHWYKKTRPHRNLPLGFPDHSKHSKMKENNTNFTIIFGRGLK